VISRSNAGLIIHYVLRFTFYGSARASPSYTDQKRGWFLKLDRMPVLGYTLCGMEVWNTGVRNSLKADMKLSKHPQRLRGRSWKVLEHRAFGLWLFALNSST